jgi:glycerol-3-phosphate acyltransferase PlsY
MRHHDNIQRLWRGQEGKIWGKFRKKKDGVLEQEEHKEE